MTFPYIHISVSAKGCSNCCSVPPEEPKPKYIVFFDENKKEFVAFPPKKLRDISFEKYENTHKQVESEIQRIYSISINALPIEVVTPIKGKMITVASLRNLECAAKGYHTAIQREKSGSSINSPYRHYEIISAE